MSTETPEFSDLGGPQSVKAVLSNKRGLSTSIVESLGALAIGVVVLGGIGFAVGAGYNYAQDSTAQASLETVKAAQVLYQSKNQTFGTLAELTAAPDPALTDTPDRMAIAATATNYCAYVKSSSMFEKEYWLTAKSGKLLEVAPTEVEAGVACPTI